jgi:hypothetical protein
MNGVILEVAKVAASNISKKVDDLARQCDSGKQKGCSELVRIAVEDKDAGARRVAVEKLTDQSLLAKIAVEDKDSDVRCTAVEKLTDQSVLAKIAVEDKDSGVRRTAVEKLTDRLLLAKIAVGDEDTNVRSAAEGGVGDITEGRSRARLVPYKDVRWGTPSTGEEIVAKIESNDSIMGMVILGRVDRGKVLASGEEVYIINPNDRLPKFASSLEAGRLAW